MNFRLARQKCVNVTKGHPELFLFNVLSVTGLDGTTEGGRKLERLQKTRPPPPVSLG